MIRYKCPKCGKKVVKSIICEVPTRDRYACTKCEYFKEVPEANRTVVAPE